MKDRLALILLTAISVVYILLMLPFREQSFQDDFAYAQSVSYLINHHQIKISEFLAPTSVFHVVWGALFAKIFGFSFISLQISVIIFLPLLLIAVYKLLRSFEIPEERSFLLTVFFSSIPWIFQFSSTFMTDVPFLTLEVLSLYFYNTGIKNNKNKSLFIASFFASLAFLTRQIGILIPISFLLAEVVLSREKNKLTQKLFASLTLPAVVLFSYIVWVSDPLNKTVTQFDYQDLTTRNIFSFLPFTNVNLVQRINLFGSLLHRTINYLNQAVGLFFPIMFTFFLFNTKKIIKFLNQNKEKFLILISSLFLIYLFDLLTNLKIYTTGFPLFIYRYERLFPIPWAHVWAYEVFTGLLILLSFFCLPIKNFKKNATSKKFFLLSFLLILITTIISPFSWDQYIIPLLPFILVWFATISNQLKINYKIITILLFFLLIDSIQMAKIRYDENGIIWTTASRLVSQGIDPNQIDPDQNTAWDKWNNYESFIKNNLLIENNRKVIKPTELPPPSPKYIFISETLSKFAKKLPLTAKIQRVHFRSLFVESSIIESINQ